jgi:hypothetical protein
MRSLIDSFVHNVLIHPLLFVRDVAERAGFVGAALLLSRAHDDHWVWGESEHEFSPTPEQHPWTPEAEAMVYRGRPEMPPPADAAPLTGSVADRMQRARGAH